MYCKNCGAEIREGAIFCTECGESVETIVNSSSLELPEKIVLDDIKANKENLIERAKQQGINFEQYLQLTNQTEEELIAKIRENCERNLKTSFVFGKIAKDNNVTIKDEDIENEFAKIAESYKMDVETVKKALAGRVNELANNIFMSKIHDLLVESNNIK